MGLSKSSILSYRIVKKVENLGFQNVYDIEVKDNHNFVANGVVVHNCHKLPAPVFSQTLQKFNAKYLLGLTATPERWDGLDALLQYGLGGKLNKIVLGTQMTPEVYIMHHPTRLSPGSYKYTWGINAGKINYSKLINLIAYSAPRNKYITGMVIDAAKKERKIMVFSDRLDQLSTLKEWFDQEIPDKSAMFVGGTKPKDREKAMQAQVMFCTYQYCAEALDVPERDCVFLASPKSKVSQVMGRVLRSQDGKRCPIVVDICDPFVPVLEMFSSKRAQEYRSSRARIHLPNGQVLR
jgi:superfamily II DNA or RNA helicase